MESINEFHPAIQYAARRLANPDLTFAELGLECGITKQAVEQQYKKAIVYFKDYSIKKVEPELLPCSDCVEKDGVTSLLRQQLILYGVQLQELIFFKESVLKFFPRFSIPRIPASEKKQILDWSEKFKSAGGLVKDFAKHIGRSPETLARWLAAYEKYGLSGLVDKPSRPKNFGNRVPLWVKKHLLTLFLKYPRWTTYQYHSHIRHNPAINWYVCLPVIKKLKDMYTEKSEAEKARIKKLWCFAPGTEAWTIDFTCILMTPSFKLQVLTVSDHRSRYMLHAALYLKTSVEFIMNDLEDLFIKHGIPNMIKADNGPEFRLELKDELKKMAVHLINSPSYYGQFNGAHERIHRKLKEFIDQFSKHQNLTKLVGQIQEFLDQYNYEIPMDSLDGKTPSEIFLSSTKNFMPKGAEVIKPYEKDGELRMKFTDRDGNLARTSVPLIPTTT